jgi:exopolysaccharide biosynthesis polyprenyl glycosylphosphotransferase
MPLAAVTPALDALALVAAAALAGQANGLGIAYVVAVLLIPVGAGFRPSRISPRLSQDVGPLLARVAIPVIPLALLTPTNADAGRFLVTGVLAAALLLLARFLAYALIRAARAGGFLVERALIAGAGSTGIEIASTLKDHPEYGLEPIGFLDSFQEDGLPLPILGECRDLPDVVRTFHANRVIVAFGATREPEMVQVLRACDELPVEVHLVPRFFELGVAPGGPLTDDIWGIPLVRLRRSALRSVAWGAKRAFDIVFGGLLLVVTSPLFLACAVAVRLSGPGPILFRQERIGQRGEVFELLKFRSMLELPDSDTVWAVDEEERCTAVGRILRRSDLDELPQLINVLRGEMSLVGPRPERPFFADQFRVAVPGYGDRHRVPVGMSGWAQVHGLRGNTSIAERARFDNHYIEHWSMWKDALIVVRTVGHVIRGAVGRRA